VGCETHLLAELSRDQADHLWRTGHGRMGDEDSLPLLAEDGRLVFVSLKRLGALLATMVAASSPDVATHAHGGPSLRAPTGTLTSWQGPSPRLPVAGLYSLDAAVSSLPPASGLSSSVGAKDETASSRTAPSQRSAGTSLAPKSSAWPGFVPVLPTGADAFALDPKTEEDSQELAKVVSLSTVEKLSPEVAKMWVSPAGASSRETVPPSFNVSGMKGVFRDFLRRGGADTFISRVLALDGLTQVLLLVTPIFALVSFRELQATRKGVSRFRDPASEDLGAEFRRCREAALEGFLAHPCARAPRWCAPQSLHASDREEAAQLTANLDHACKVLTQSANGLDAPPRQEFAGERFQGRVDLAELTEQRFCAAALRRLTGRDGSGPRASPPDTRCTLSAESMLACQNYRALRKAAEKECLELHTAPSPPPSLWAAWKQGRQAAAEARQGLLAAGEPAAGANPPNVSPALSHAHALVRSASKGFHSLLERTSAGDDAAAAAARFQQDAQRKQREQKTTSAAEDARLGGRRVLSLTVEGATANHGVTGRAREEEERELALHPPRSRLAAAASAVMHAPASALRGAGLAWGAAQYARQGIGAPASALVHAPASALRSSIRDVQGVCSEDMAASDMRDRKTIEAILASIPFLAKAVLTRSFPASSRAYQAVENAIECVYLANRREDGTSPLPALRDAVETQEREYKAIPDLLLSRELAETLTATKAALQAEPGTGLASQDLQKAFTAAAVQGAATLAAWEATLWMLRVVRDPGPRETFWVQNFPLARRLFAVRLMSWLQPAVFTSTRESLSYATGGSGPARWVYPVQMHNVPDLNPNPTANVWKAALDTMYAWVSTYFPALAGLSSAAALVPAVGTLSAGGVIVSFVAFAHVVYSMNASSLNPFAPASLEQKPAQAVVYGVIMPGLLFLSEIILAFFLGKNALFYFIENHSVGYMASNQPGAQPQGAAARARLALKRTGRNILVLARYLTWLLLPLCRDLLGMQGFKGFNVPAMNMLQDGFLWIFDPVAGPSNTNTVFFSVIVLLTSAMWLRPSYLPPIRRVMRRIHLLAAPLRPAALTALLLWVLGRGVAHQQVRYGDLVALVVSVLGGVLLPEPEGAEDEDGRPGEDGGAEEMEDDQDGELEEDRDDWHSVASHSSDVADLNDFRDVEA